MATNTITLTAQETPWDPAEVGFSRADDPDWMTSLGSISAEPVPGYVLSRIFTSPYASDKLGIQGNQPLDLITAIKVDGVAWTMDPSSNYYDDGDNLTYYYYDPTAKMFVDGNSYSVEFTYTGGGGGPPARKAPRHAFWF